MTAYNILFIGAWFALLFALGAWMRVLDRRKGREWYRSLSNHLRDPEDPLPMDSKIGFIDGQPARRRFFIALATSLLIMGVLGNIDGQYFLVDILLFFLGVPAIYWGIRYGPQCEALWKRMTEFFKQEDEKERASESAKTTSTIEVPHRIWGFVERLKNALPNVKIADPQPKQEPTPQTAVPPTVEPQPKPQDMINRYTKRRGSNRSKEN